MEVHLLGKMVLLEPKILLIHLFYIGRKVVLSCDNDLLVSKECGYSLLLKSFSA